MKPIARRRGAAAVELAVLCLVLVPLIMYTMFLAEMFVMKLNGQEGALQAPWDFTLVDFSNPEKKVEHDGAIARQSRRTYCDHSAAYNSYNLSYDCTDQNHHSTMTAHECWLTKPGQQVKCARVSQPLTGSGQEGIQIISQSFPLGRSGRVQLSVGRHELLPAQQVPRELHQRSDDREAAHAVSLGRPSRGRRRPQ